MDRTEGKNWIERDAEEEKRSLEFAYGEVDQMFREHLISAHGEAYAEQSWNMRAFGAEGCAACARFLERLEAINGDLR